MNTLRFFTGFWWFLLWGIVLVPSVGSAQHMLEKRYTAEDGMAMTETGSVAEDADGYIWITSTNGMLSRFDGREFTVFSPGRTSGVGVDELIPLSYTDNVIGINDQTAGLRYNFLFRGDSIKAFPINRNYRTGEDMPNRSVLLFADDWLYFTEAGDTKIIDSIRVPEVAGYSLENASRLGEENYHLTYRGTDEKRLDYRWRGGDTIRVPPVSWFNPNGTFVHFLHKENIVRHYTYEGRLIIERDWTSYLPRKSEFRTLRRANGCIYLSYYVEATDPDELPSNYIFEIDPIALSRPVLYGTYRRESTNSHRNAIGRNGEVWGVGHVGLRRMMPHTGSYPSNAGRVVSSLHAVGQLANGDIYLGGYGTGFTRIDSDGKPERLIRNGFLANEPVLPGTFPTADGGVLFISERKDKAIVKVTADGYYQPSRINTKQPHRNTGFGFTEVRLPPESPVLRRDGASVSPTGRYLLINMTLDKKSGELHGRLGITPLPYEPTNRVVTVGTRQGIKVRNVLCSAQDRAGRIWFGHPSTGLGVYDPLRDTAYTSVNEQINDPGALSMIIDQNDRLWLGSKTGLRFIDSVSTLALPLSSHLRSRQKMVAIRQIPKSYVGSLYLLGDTLFIGHMGGLSVMDINDSNPTQPQALTLPINDYLGGAEQNGFLLARDSALWLVADDGAVRLDIQKILRGRRMPGRLKISIRGDESPEQFVDWEEIRIPRGDRTIHYTFRQSVFDQVDDELLVDMLLLTESGDTIRSSPLLKSGQTERIDYLLPGTYTLVAKAYHNNKLQKEQRTEIVIPRRVTECWWFWVLCVLSVIVPLAMYFWYSYVRTQEALAREQLENERNRALLETSQLRRQSDRLQVSTLSNAVNPHFISNAITWLQSAYLVGRPIEGINVMSDNLAKTIRTMFTNSTDGRISHGLDEELKLVERYLATVNIQYDGRYAFILPTDAERKVFASYQVLLMQVQVHVENAVEHGLRYRPEGRELTIRLREDNTRVYVMIEDSGAGINYVRERQESQGHRAVGRGTRIMLDLQETFNRYNPEPLETKTESPVKTDERDRQYGTRITITVPKNYDYAIESHRD